MLDKTYRPGAAEEKPHASWQPEAPFPARQHPAASPSPTVPPASAPRWALLHRLPTLLVGPGPMAFPVMSSPPSWCAASVVIVITAPLLAA